MPKNNLIQLSGPPGSGKSTTARLLSGPLNATIIDNDLLKSFFLENSVTSGAIDPFDEAAKLAYRLQWVLAEEFMAQGSTSASQEGKSQGREGATRSIIIDCVVNYNEVLETGQALADKYGWIYHYVEIRADSLDLLDSRMKRRVPLRSQRTGVLGRPRDMPANAQMIESEVGMEDSGARKNGSGEDIGVEVEKMKQKLKEKWMNPKRPADGGIVVSATGDLEERKVYILDKILGTDK
ncbi:hypothetical protein BT63DRAFT_180010 [Microthyrium microscopicum]|uniref:P-loop containing nucleoside triphosphate hydrolase protein n=1 Tax=Microthyrium microscopicum TaxID=703497 RepID=A0A6A6UJX7_9PEZI|nr:hypothetical protein BT63DRAFT_180010 [Microthyrium microscopicum]